MNFLLLNKSYKININNKCFIIAELSANHGGYIEIAKETIRAAKRSGADAIKLQTYLPSTMTLQSDKDDFKVKASKIKDYITDKTKMIILNSPNNPSGSMYSENELRAIGDVLKNYPNIFVLSDEIYEHIQYGNDHFSFAAIHDMYERTITVNGVAKAFAMTGWRIGYIGAPEWIAKACTKLQGQVTSGANCIAQKATIAAITADVKQISYMVDEFKSRKKLIIELMSEIKGIKLNNPDGAFYIFPDISYYFGKEIDGFKINNSSDFSMFLLEKAHVATVTGSAFGCPNNIRISYAASKENISEAIKRIKAVLA